MKILGCFALILITSLFSLVGCGQSSGSLQLPPPKYQGTWASAEAAPCDTQIIKIDEHGDVLSAKKVLNTNEPYVLIGRLKADGIFIPNPEVEGEYVAGSANLVTGGALAKPLVSLEVSSDQTQMIMDIKVVTNSVAGLYVSDVVESRNFDRIFPEQEQVVLDSVQVCSEQP